MLIRFSHWFAACLLDAGGSDRGYFIYRVTNGAGTSVLFLMNGEGRSRGTAAMSRAMDRLVEGR